MAENDFVAADDNLNVQDQLREVLSELRDQREQVQSLKEELQGSALSVASERKKLKKEKDVVWKYQARGEYNHIRRQCPHVNRGAGAAKVQSTSKAE